MGTKKLRKNLLHCLSRSVTASILVLRTEASEDLHHPSETDQLSHEKLIKN